MWYLEVTSIKQFEYCPRVVFFTHCLPLLYRPTTYKMDASIEIHKQAPYKERRRSLCAYGIKQGKRYFDVSLLSQRLGISGQIDMAIVTKDKKAIPVDYKLTTRKVGQHFKLQIAAYAVLLEENWKCSVENGYIYSLLTRKTQKITISNSLRQKMKRHIQKIRSMIENQQMPNSTAVKARCVNCEFRRFCNDTL